MKKDQNILFWFFVAGMALLGGVLVYVISAPFGLGLIPDSIAYLQGAKHLALGQGYLVYDKAAHLVPNNWYPPGLSILLSLGWFVGEGFLNWARILNSFLFCGNIFLAVVIVYYITQSRFASLVTAGIFLTSVHMWQEHGRLVSEPLFIFVFLGWVLSMLVFMRTRDKNAFYIAAFCAGISGLIRYAGIPVIIAGACWLLIRGKKENRMLDSGFFLLTAGILPAILLLRNSFLTGHAAGGSLGMFMQDPASILIVVNSFSEWILPASISFIVRWIVLVIGVAALVKWLMSHGSQLKEEVRDYVLLMGVFSVVYLLLGTGIKFFMHSDFVLSSRLLAPVFTLMIVGAGVMSSMIPRSWTLMKKAATGVLVIFISLSAARSVQLARTFYRQGYDYASKSLITSKLAETLRSIDDRVPLYSNKPEALYHLAGRPAVRIPWIGEGVDYFPAMAIIADDFKKRHAVAVIFDMPRFVPSETWLKMSEVSGMEILMTDKTGNIYGVKKK